MRTERVVMLALLAVLAVVPPFLERYHQNVLIYVVLFSYLGVAWNILGGLTGLPSFGNAAFFGIGAYASGMLYTTYRVSPWIGMWAGVALSTGLAALIGYLTFRFGIRGHFFILATIAFAEILRNVVLNLEVLGGARGLPIPLTPEDSLVDLQFHTNRIAYYYIALGLLIAGTLVFWKLKNSSLGLALMCIKEDEEKAATLGINTLRHKIFAFVLSAVMTSIAGTVYAHYVLYVEPMVVLGVPLSVQIALVAVVGGLGTTLGPVLGGFIVQTIMEYTRIFFGRFPGLDFFIAGILLIAIALLRPTGLLGLIERLIPLRTLAR